VADVGGVKGDVSLERRGSIVRLLMGEDCVIELGREEFKWILEEAKRRGFIRPSIVTMRLPRLSAKERLKVALWFSQYLGVPLTG